MTEQIRVLHIVGRMVGGGVESMVMNYFRAINRDRVCFDFAVDADSTAVPEEEITSLGGRVFRVAPYSKPHSFIRDLRHVIREGEKGGGIQLSTHTSTL